ncbi:hypothetical protein V496_01701 [Pseudogymnoascus sp. VKM F-4515 (FW-2607)]|nr:hypothetical protein V496_01701 [Pseudogymnoascus sp. VKM F-4515 (FW-2607)]
MTAARASACLKRFEYNVARRLGMRGSTAVSAKRVGAVSDASSAAVSTRVIDALHVWAVSEQRATHSDLDPAQHDGQWRISPDDQPTRSSPVPPPAKLLLPAAD